MESLFQPFLTIGIPTYKRPNRLKDLLTSLANQIGLNPIDFEVIISDNHSQDLTENIVNEFKNVIPNLKYYCNSSNIGPDRNIRSVIDKSAGKFVWVLPDDDFIADNSSVKNIILEIRNCKIEPSLIILNSAIAKLGSKEILKPKTININGNIFLENGLDILFAASDMDILAVNKLILKRNAFPGAFEQKNIGNGNTGPIAMALTAASHGPALIISNIYTYYGEGDSALWRKKWGYIYYIEIIKTLNEAVIELGLDKVHVDMLIEKKKQISISDVVAPIDFILQRNNFSWRGLAEIYGVNWVFWNLLQSPYYMISLLKIFKRNKK